MSAITFTVYVPITIDVSFIRRVLTTAFEGKHNYWIRDAKILRDIENTRHYAEVVACGGEIIIEDFEGKEHLVTREKFIEGYQKYIQWCLDNEAPIKTDSCNIDDSTADIILQFAIYKGVVWN